MAQQWRCPRGHTWQAAKADETLQVGTQTRCPVCGSNGTLLPGEAPAPQPNESRGHTLGNAMDATLDPAKPPPAPNLSFKGKNKNKKRDGASKNLPPQPQPMKADSSGEATLVPPPAGDSGKGGPGQADSQTQLNSETRPPGPGKEPLSTSQTVQGSNPEITVTSAESANIKVSGYEILEVLGRGGMGVVYKARQKGLNRLTALKMILSGAHASKQDLARFQIEAEAVAKLQHPNIVQIYDVGERDGHPYFSLEYVDGGTLQSKTEGKPLPFREAAQIVEGLARAIHYAHQQGIIHRDLKPANVLLAADGTPKITDFGLAKKLGSDSKQTGTGAIMGTPSYMAPEQAKGQTADIGPAADIYSLGAIFYDLLTGRPPFCGATILDTLQLVQNEDPVPPRRLQPRVPADLETICLKCLQKEIHKRYVTGEEMANDLRRFLNNEPIKARPVSILERSIKWARRRPAVAALLAMLFLVIAGGFLGMLGLWLRAEGLREQADLAALDAKAHASEAKDQTKEALKAKEAALLAANEARAAEKQALAAKQKSQESLEYARRTLYGANMNLAQDAFQNAKVHRLKELLEGQQPKEPGALNLRGFEWNYLWHLYHSDRLALKSHVQMVRSVAFQPPDGKQLASASGDGTVVLWRPDAATDPKFTILPGHKSSVRAIAFSKDGRWLASGAEDNLILVWDMQALNQPPRKLTGHQHWVNSVAFNAAGTMLASASEDQTIRLWDLENYRESATLNGHLYGVTDVTFSDDGKRLASADLDKKVRVWDVATRKEIFHPLEHRHWVSCVAFSPSSAGDNAYLVSGGWEDRIRVWSAVNGNLEFVLEGLTSPVKHLAFSPEGQRLACSCQDNSVVVWDIPTKKIIRTLPGEKSLVRSVAFSPDGQLLASVNFDLLTQEILQKQLTGSLLTMSFGGDAQHLASGGAQGTIFLWTLEKEQSVKELTGHTGPVRALTFSGPRKEWASAGEDGQIFFWNVEGEKINSFPAHERWILALAFHPQGDTLASGSADHTIGLWNLDSRNQRHVLKGHTGPVLTLAYRPDGTMIASGSADRSLRLWKVNGTPTEFFKADHEGPVTKVAFSPSGKLLASAGWDRVIKVWDVDKGTLLQTLRGHTHGVSSLAFTKDGTRLASGSEDRTVKIWDLITGQETLTLKGPSQGVTDLAFSPEGTRLACTSWDGTMTVWEAPAASGK